MDGFYHPGMSREEWIMSGPPNVTDYNYQGQEQIMQTTTTNQQPAPVQRPEFSNNFNDLVQLQLQMLNNPKQPLPPTNIFESSKPQQLTSFGPPKSFQFNSQTDIYNPFVEDNDFDNDEDMDISDGEKESQTTNNEGIKTEKAAEKVNTSKESSKLVSKSLEVTSGAAFYQGLILYIPPFEQLAHTYRGSPALKMLYASFEFSFKMPVKIETKPMGNQQDMGEATVSFKDHIIARGSGTAPHVEASVRALELLSETCYTIQAKEDYFLKCKLVDAENMKTLNLKKWEAVSEKYPKIVEATKESHIQKTFAVFLDSHTSTGMYEDIVCCNLTRQDVSHIKSVVEFFHLTMLPCSISTNLSRKHTPCVVSIHKYTSAKKLLDILIECGGENDKFKLYPPDTFKDFYKLHPGYWDPNLKDKPENTILEDKTTLEDPTLQALIMQPYENLISVLFEKHKTLPKTEKASENSSFRKAGDDFMKHTFQIDMAQSKNKAPVERMQLLLKYMEQLQEYGSRVLTSGRTDMIKIYHNAIDNVRKDLEQCRKDIEKEQKDKEKAAVVKAKESSKSSTRSQSPSTRKRTSPRRRSKSPAKKSQGTVRRSPSPRRRPRSKSPRRQNRTRRSPSPRRRPLSPPRRGRSKSPRRPARLSPSRRIRSPKRTSPPRRSPQPSHTRSQEDIIIFKDQFRRYMDALRRFRIEIEDTPIERRSSLRDRMMTMRVQLNKFKKDLKENPAQLGEFQFELEICRDELLEQDLLISGKSVGPNDIPPSTQSPMDNNNIQSRPLMPPPYFLPNPPPFVQNPPSFVPNPPSFVPNPPPLNVHVPPPPMVVYPPKRFGYPY